MISTETESRGYSLKGCRQIFSNKRKRLRVGLGTAGARSCCFSGRWCLAEHVTKPGISVSYGTEGLCKGVAGVYDDDFLTGSCDSSI